MEAMPESRRNDVWLHFRRDGTNFEPRWMGLFDTAPDEW